VFTVYIIKSLSSGKTYVGQTSNLEFRLREHQSDLSHYTKGRGPWELIHKEEYDTRVEATSREKFFKGGRGRDLIKEILGRDCQR